MAESSTPRPHKRRRKDVHVVSKEEPGKEVGHVSTSKRLKHKEDVAKNPQDTAWQVELATHISDTLSDKPKASKLVVLLTNGLRNGDEQLLSAVLRTRDEGVITSTLRQVPAQLVPSIVREIGRRLRENAQTDLALARWLRVALLLHSSYLTSFPELIESMRALLSITEQKATKQAVFEGLQGKLNLLLSHVALQRGVSAGSQQALLQYTDDDSSESDEDIPFFENSEDETVVRWTDDGSGDEDDDDASSDEG